MIVCDQDTYELRLLHCPEGCGYRATHRVVESAKSALCPRCGGAELGMFRDDEQLPLPRQIEEAGHSRTVVV